MSTNAGPEYFVAEKRYLEAKTPEEKIQYLEEMIRLCPKHKSSENMVANLKQRLNKLMEKAEKTKSSGKSTQKTIKKEGFQVALIGLPNSGKSSLLAKLTNAKPLITPHPFSTRQAEVGTLEYKGIKAQIVDIPSIGSEFFDKGIVNTADLVLEVIESLGDLEKISPSLLRATGKKLIVITKSDLLSSEQLRKLEETVKSKKLNAVIISCILDYNIEQLKDKIFKSMDAIRVYTKEPGKQPTKDPVVLKANSTVYDIAEKILKGFSKKVKETRVTGPSSKFPNQKVGLSHILKDLDIVEFHTN
jgi:ribosome-interacting GTPase 1